MVFCSPPTSPACSSGTAELPSDVAKPFLNWLIAREAQSRPEVRQFVDWVKEEIERE